jgi:predicted MFS family arabinose efflux permease
MRDVPTPSSPRPVAPGRERQISRGLVVALAATAGLSAANLYYAQPLLPSIAHALGASESTTGLLVTLTQAGYALGLSLIVPLGDLVQRRRLIVVLMLADVGALAASALAPTLGALLAISAGVGLLSCVAQVTVPFAADLAPEARRGQVVGAVMSGLLIGILLSRTGAGLAAELGSWRTVYDIGAGLTLLLAIGLWRMLPVDPPGRTQETWGGLILSALRLARDERLLRLRALYGALGFASFSCLWTSLAFLLAGPRYHFDPAEIGLFGLAGLAGASIATVAGRFVDRGHEKLATGAFLAIGLGSWGLSELGRSSLLALVAGAVLLDLGVQGTQVTNQGVVYGIGEGIRSRINMVYMTLYFVGGLVGSTVSAELWSKDGWTGVCAAGGAMFAIGLLRWAADVSRPRRARSGSGPDAAHREVQGLANISANATT